MKRGQARVPDWAWNRGRIKNGARCRIRTCGPFRVKEVLYH